MNCFVIFLPFNTNFVSLLSFPLRLESLMTQRNSKKARTGIENLKILFEEELPKAMCQIINLELK